MPEWVIHDKWATKAGITQETSRFVNLMVDFPQKCQDFLSFCDQDDNARVYRRSRATKMDVGPMVGHDMGRHANYAKDVQIRFLSGKGEQFIRAYYLHHLLDYITTWARSIDPARGTHTPVSDILERRKVKQGIAPDGRVRPLDDSEWSAVKKFVLNNGAEIYLIAAFSARRLFMQE